MKKSFVFALALVAGLGGAFAQTLQLTPKTEGNYTYYIDGQCDIPVICDDAYEGPSCAAAYGSSIVYDAPGCEIAHQTSNILGKLPQF